MKSHLWSKPRDSRCTFIVGSGTRVTIGTDRGALPPVWTEKRGRVAPKDPSDKFSACDRASAKPTSGAVLTAHAELVAILVGQPPQTIPLDADAIDLEDRAHHLDKLFGALLVYLTVILDDTAQNVPEGLDLPDIEAVLADLASDVTGTIQQAADGMAGRVA